MTAVLSTEGLSVSFGAVQALDGVDLELREGQLVGLIGPNGAGKTTLIDAVTGFVAASGRVLFRGRDVSALPAHRRARAGIARTWQTIELFDDLSVRENLAVAARRSTITSALGEILLGRQPRAEQLAEEAVELLELGDVAEAMPSDLPQGRRKLVGIARALAARPGLVLLDEPAAGLDSHESQDLGRRLRRVVDRGLPGLLVDHDMGLVLGICDHIYVLDFGRCIAHGSPSEVRADPLVLAAYLGGAAAAAGKPGRREGGQAGPATAGTGSNGAGSNGAGANGVGPDGAGPHGTGPVRDDGEGGR